MSSPSRARKTMSQMGNKKEMAGQSALPGTRRRRHVERGGGSLHQGQGSGSDSEEHG
jgi:hypothetical protein